MKQEPFLIFSLFDVSLCNLQFSEEKNLNMILYERNNEKKKRIFFKKLTTTTKRRRLIRKKNLSLEIRF